MVGSSRLIICYESNRLIFKTFEEFDKDGNISEGSAFFTEANRKQQEFNQKNFETTLNRQKQMLTDYFDVYNAAIESDPKKSPAQAFEEASKKIENADDAVKQYARDQVGLNGSVDDFEKKQRAAFDASNKGFKGLSTSTTNMLKNIGATMAIAAAVQLAMAGLSKLNDYFNITDSAKLEDMEAAIGDYNDAISASKENISTLQGLEDEFNTLSKGVDENGRNVGLSAEQFQRYNEIVDEIAGISPELVRGYSAEGNAILDRNTAIEEGIRLQEEYADSATASYTSLENMNYIIEGAGVDFKDAYGNLSDSGKDLAKLLKDTEDSYKQVRRGQVKKVSKNGIINDILGEDIDLQSMDLSELEAVVSHSDQILGQVAKMKRESGTYTEKEYEQIRDSLSSMEGYWQDLEDASQPVYDNLIAWASRMRDDGTSIVSEIPDELQSAFQTGLKDLSMQGVYEGLDAQELRSRVRDLSNGLQELYDSNEAASKDALGYKDALEQAAEAKEKFAETGDVEKYNKAIRESADSLYALADAQEAAGNDALADALRAQAAEISDYAQQVVESLEGVFNPYQEKFETAAGVNETFEEWREGITDYLDGIESYKAMLDTVLDDNQEYGGNGSMAFWKAAELSLGEKSIREMGYNIDSVRGKMDELQSAMSSGGQATEYFYRQLWNNAEEINGLLGEDSVLMGADGGIRFNIESDEWATVADVLGIAEDSMLALLSAATQFSNIDLSDTDAVVNAIKAQETSFTEDGVTYALSDPIEKAAAQQLGSIEAAHRRIQELNEEEDISLISLDTLTDNVNYTKEQMQNQLGVWEDYQAQAREVASTFTELGFGTKEGDGFKFTEKGIQDTTNSLLMMGATADQVYATLKAWRDDDSIDIGKYEDMKDEQLKEQADDLYSSFTEASKEADPYEKMANSANQLTDAINRLSAALGVMPDLNIDDNLDEIQNKIDKFNESTDEAEKKDLKKSIKKDLDSTKGDLDLSKTALDKMDEGDAGYDQALKDYEAQLKKYESLRRMYKDIKDDGEINGSVKIDDADAKSKLADIKEEMGDLSNKEVIAKCQAVVENQGQFESFLNELDGIDGKDKKVAIEAVTAAANGDLQGFAQKLDQLPDNVRSDVIAYVTGEGNVSQLAQTIDGVVGKQVEVIANTAGEAKLTFLKGLIDSIKSKTVQVTSTMTTIAQTVYKKATGKAASGTPNRRKQSHFPSMARGSKIGPNGRGGPTLTGELGTELVWLPNEDESFLVGLYGPEVVDLPSDAVVYPADETRRIVGDTIPRGRMRFASMASGSGYYLGSYGGSSSSSSSKKSSSSSSKSSSSKSKSSSNEESPFEINLKKLQHQLEMGYITQQQYYSKYKALYNKYSKSLAKDVDKQREALEDLRDAWIDAYEEQVDLLNHQLEMGTINESQYYSKLEALGKKYFKNRKGYTNEWRDHLEELKDARKDAYDAQLEDLDESLEKETITVEKYYKQVSALQKKWLSGKEMADDLEDAMDDMYDAMQDALDEMYDDLQQQIDDNDLFNLWVEGGDTAVDMLKDFRNQMEKDGRKYFETEKEWREWLLELDRDIAEAEKDQAEDHQDQLETVIDLVEQMIRQEAQDYVDALEDQKDAYAELIDAKKEALRLSENELEFQKEMNDYAKDASKLQAQIDLLARDDSRAAAAKRAELEEQLAELLEEQQQAQRDETLDRTEDTLDEQLELFEDLVDKQIESVDNWLDNQAAVLDKVMETIENRETNDLLNRLISYVGESGDAMLSTVNEAWKDISDLADKYGNDVEKMVEILQKGIDVNVTGGIISVDQTDYAETQQKTQDKYKTHHSGLAAGFTGDGADLKQHEVYRKLTDDELILNREDQIRIAEQLSTLETIKNSFASLSKGIETPQTQNNQSVELVINAPITIEGNADTQTANEIKRAIKEASDSSLERLTDALRINGVRTRTASNLRKN